MQARRTSQPAALMALTDPVTSWPAWQAAPRPARDSLAAAINGTAQPGRTRGAMSPLSPLVLPSIRGAVARVLARTLFVVVCGRQKHVYVFFGTAN
jgi:hypothetical protein